MGSKGREIEEEGKRGWERREERIEGEVKDGE